MYEIIYKKNGEELSIKGPVCNFKRDENNRHYKQYLLDIENGIEAIDNPPTDTEILEVKKQSKINEIDSKTQELIYSGFEHNTFLFSLSDNARGNWTVLRFERDALIYPYEISTKNDGQYYIQNVEEMKTFTDKALHNVENILSVGRALKVQILACENNQELETIEDGR